MSDPTYEPVITANGGDSAPDRAKNEARHVADDAKEGAAQVADTVKQETREVAHDVQRQAKDVYRQVRSEATDQASSQQRRAASGLHSLASELDQMVSGAQDRGVASDLAQQAAQRVHTLATWLEAREPGDLVEELRAFARRRPGAFLAGAAAVGVVAGRMTRGLTDSPDEGSNPSAERLGDNSGWTSGGALGDEARTPATNVPTAGLSTGDETTTYTTGPRLDEGRTGDETAAWSGHVGDTANGSDTAFRETSLDSDAGYDAPTAPQTTPRHGGDRR